eukprot:GHVO01045920.1.p2 GENE.GHVO01045920.1~~GHVO01045920.1.p2  ORF type:complete len:102 (-),score=14.96 GHVO01045920.1:1468-1773(-)
MISIVRVLGLEMFVFRCCQIASSSIQLAKDLWLFSSSNDGGSGYRSMRGNANDKSDEFGGGGMYDIVHGHDLNGRKSNRLFSNSSADWMSPPLPTKTEIYE